MYYLILVLGICSAILTHAYFSDNPEEIIWWNFLCSGVFLSIVLLVSRKTRTKHESQQKLFATLFILSNTVRSIFPRIDVERICYVDNIWSTTIVGRSFATIGEVALSLQIANSLLHTMKPLAVQSILPYILPPAIFVAQILCWFGVLTTNQLFHVFEESIWAGVSAMIIPLLLKLVKKTEDSKIQKKLLAFVIIDTVYVIYMLLVDIPMYYRRYTENNESGYQYLSLREGLYDAMSCKLVTTKYEVWKEDAMWMIGYFVFGSFISVGMING